MDTKTKTRLLLSVYNVSDSNLVSKLLSECILLFHRLVYARPERQFLCYSDSRTTAEVFSFIISN